MRQRMNRGWSIEAALFVALFIVVQAFFSGLSIGARADTLDRAGPVLCLGSGSIAAAERSGPADRTHFADCCTLGCPMLGGLPAPQAATETPPPVLAGPASHPYAEAHNPGRFELAPLHSRAPPEA